MFTQCGDGCLWWVNYPAHFLTLSWVTLSTREEVPLHLERFGLPTWAVSVHVHVHGCSPNIELYFSKPLRLLWILVCFIVCDSSFFLLCSLLSFIAVHYARDCSCTCSSDGRASAQYAVCRQSSSCVAGSSPAWGSSCVAGSSPAWGSSCVAGSSPAWGSSFFSVKIYIFTCNFLVLGGLITLAHSLILRSVTLSIGKRCPFNYNDSACPTELPRWLSWSGVCLACRMSWVWIPPEAAHSFSWEKASCVRV